MRVSREVNISEGVDCQGPAVVIGDPPRKDEPSRVLRLASSIETKTSQLPLREVSKTPGVAGKSAEYVMPVTYTFPVFPKTIEAASSSSEPPRKVEARSAVKPGSILDKNASCPPLTEVS